MDTNEPGGAGLPDTVDPIQFARKGEQRAGHCGFDELPRLAESGVLGLERLEWRVKGSRARDEMDRLREFLEVDLRFAPTMRCVRCIEPVDLPEIHAHNRFRFAASESQAAAEDRGADDVDVLAAGSALDLGALVEDEALLALPMAPAHEGCRLNLPTA